MWNKITVQRRARDNLRTTHGNHVLNYLIGHGQLTGMVQGIMSITSAFELPGAQFSRERERDKNHTLQPCVKLSHLPCSVDWNGARHDVYYLCF